MDYSYLNFFVGELFERCLNSLSGTANVCLNDDVKFLGTLVDLSKEIVKAYSGVELELLLLSLFTSLIGKFTSHSFVLNSVELVTCHGNLSKTCDLNGNRGTCFLNYFTAVVSHRSYVTNRCTCDNSVACAECTVLNEHRCNGTAAAVKLSLDDKSLSMTCGISLKLLHFGNEEHALEKIVDTLSCNGRYGNTHYVAAPLLGNELILGKLCLDVFGISCGLIHFIDGNYDVNTRALCVVDSLDGLRHDAVVSRNY